MSLIPLKSLKSKNYHKINDFRIAIGILFTWLCFLVERILCFLAHGKYFTPFFNVEIMDSSYNSVESIIGKDVFVKMIKK